MGRHKAGCQCVFHSGRRSHTAGCQCPWHRKEDYPQRRGPKPRPLSDILVLNGQPIRVRRLKARLFEEGLKQDRCEDCGLGPIWNGKRLVLQVDHINGVKMDWRLENIAILCPNCHSQTPTFAGRNRG